MSSCWMGFFWTRVVACREKRGGKQKIKYIFFLCHPIKKKNPMAFDAQRWIFVGDMDVCPHSKQQVGICKDLKLNIKGAILCNEADHKNSEACLKVPAFPCFCNLDSNMCVAGLRETKSQFDELQVLSDTELAKKTK